MDFKHLLIAGADAAGLETAGLEADAALLSAIGEIAGKWRELADATGKVGITDAETLIRALIDDIASPTIKDAFTRLNLSTAHATLVAKGAKLSQWLDSIPAEVRTLMQPAGTASGTISWKPLNESATVKPDDRFSLTLKASAGLSIANGLAFPAKEGAAGPYLKIGATGAANANGKGEWPIHSVMIKAGAEINADLSLDYYFAAGKPDQPYALAIADNLGALADPFDFDALWDSMAESRLHAVTYSFDGLADIAVSVAVGVEEDIWQGVGLGAALTIGVTAKRSGTVKLSVHKQVDPATGQSLVIAQSCENSKASAFTLGANISIDLSALATAVHGALEPLVKQWDAALNEIKPFLSPGALIKKELGGELQAAADRLIADARLRKAVVSDLRGAVGFDPADQSALTSWLKGEISGAADRAVAAATGTMTSGVAALRNELSKAVPAVAEDAVLGLVDTELTTLVQAVSARLTSKATALANDAAGVAKLDALLAKLNAKTSGLPDAADKALADVRALIEKYDSIIHKLLAATEEKAKAKISIELQLEERREKGQSLIINGRFLERSAANSELFSAIRRGDSRNIETLLTAGSAPGFELGAESLIKWTGKRSTKVSGSLILFGFGGKFESLATGEADVALDGSGVLRASAKAEYREQSVFSKESSTVTLVSTAALVAAGKAKDADATAASEFGVFLETKDETLSRKELRKFCTSLIKGGVASASVEPTGQAWLDDWNGPGKDTKVPVNLTAKLWLTPDQLRTMLRIDQRTDGRLSDSSRQAIAIAAADALERCGALDGNTTSTDLKAVANAYGVPKGSKASVLIVKTWDDAAWDEVQEDARHGTSGPPRVLVARFNRFRTMVKGFAELVDIMGQIYLSTPGVADANGAWSQADYEKASKRIADLAVPWAKVKPALGEVYGDVDDRTVALFALLCDLAGVPPHDALRLVMTRQARADADAVTVVLVEGGAVPD